MIISYYKKDVINLKIECEGKNERKVLRNSGEGLPIEYAAMISAETTIGKENYIVQPKKSSIRKTYYDLACSIKSFEIPLGFTWLKLKNILSLGSAAMMPHLMIHRFS
uniref:Uncharacterized protein n=1 Tax=Micrurus carvalhoi TaxID=3147026 RepID=A0A2H6NF31_9SAUR